MHKIAKVIIAQIALGELEKDLNLVLLATEVLGIKIPLTFKEVINDLKYGI